jgi:hypothetical protein
MRALGHRCRRQPETARPCRVAGATGRDSAPVERRRWSGIRRGLDQTQRVWGSARVDSSVVRRPVHSRQRTVARADSSCLSAAGLRAHRRTEMDRVRTGRHRRQSRGRGDAGAATVDAEKSVDRSFQTATPHRDSRPAVLCPGDGETQCEDRSRSQADGKRLLSVRIDPGHTRHHRAFRSARSRCDVRFLWSRPWGVQSFAA